MKKNVEGSRIAHWFFLWDPGRVRRWRPEDQFQDQGLFFWSFVSVVCGKFLWACLKCLVSLWKFSFRIDWLGAVLYLLYKCLHIWEVFALLIKEGTPVEREKLQHQLTLAIIHGWRAPPLFWLPFWGKICSTIGFAWFYIHSSVIFVHDIVFIKVVI